MGYVEIGKSEGRLLAGGGRPEGLPTGNYVAPTVFADVAPDARIFQEEIFGPVVAITPFDTDDEALALANGVKYGLAAYIWTSDLKRAHNFAQQVEAGMVWLNSHNVRDLRTPFGGVKASGLGHEGGYRSIDFYTDEQAVHITLGDVHTPRFGAPDRSAHAASSQRPPRRTPARTLTSRSRTDVTDDDPIPPPTDPDAAHAARHPALRLPRARRHRPRRVARVLRRHARAR